MSEAIRDPEELDELDARAAADFLGVSWSTLKRWPIPYRQVGERGHRRYRRADLLAFLEAHRRIPG